MPEPITDPQALGKRLYDAQIAWAARPPAPMPLPPWEEIEPDRRAYYAEMAAVLVPAVCPPGCVVVLAAEHDATERVLEAFDALVIRWGDGWSEWAVTDRERPLYEALVDLSALRALRAALAPDPGSPIGETR